MPKTKKKAKKKTKKKTKKNAYELRLGNTEERAGHRRDCAQVSVRLVCTKDAGLMHEDVTPEGFLKTVMEYLHDQTYELEIWKGFVAEIVFNADRCIVKDVKETTA